MEKEKNYRFGLYSKNDDLLDSTNIDENDPVYAMELFKEFASHENYSLYDLEDCHIELLGVTGDTSLSFEEIVVRRGHKRVTWEYIGEGNEGEYDYSDPEDVPLLRFSCDEFIDGRWEGLDSASYCTQLSIKTPLEWLIKSAGNILAIITTDGSYRRNLEGLSWLCKADFED